MLGHDGLFPRQFPIAISRFSHPAVFGFSRRRFDLFAIVRLAVQSWVERLLLFEPRNKASRHQCAINSGRYSLPRLSMPQAIRAVILASAAATTLACRRSSKALTHRLSRSFLSLALKIADRAPCISTILGLNARVLRASDQILNGSTN